MSGKILYHEPQLVWWNTSFCVCILFVTCSFDTREDVKHSHDVFVLQILYRHGMSLLLSEELSFLFGADDRPFGLWPLPLLPEAVVSRVKLHEYPLEHCPCAFHWKHSPTFPLNVSFLSFLTLGHCCPFHNIVADSEISIPHHLINLKF